jgi:hypothetical protein
MFLDLFAEIEDVQDRATALVVLRYFEGLRRAVARPLDQWPPYERLASQCRDQAELDYVALFDDLRRAIAQNPALQLEGVIALDVHTARMRGRWQVTEF